MASARKVFLPVRLTGLGVGVLALGLALYVASVTSQSSLLLVPVGILFGCGVLNAWLAWRTVHQVQITAPPSIQVAEDQPILEPWKILNPNRKPSGCFQVTAEKELVATIPPLEPQQAVHLAPELRFMRRGVYAYTAMRAESTYPFGIVRAGVPLNLPGEIVVVPAVYKAPVPPAAGLDAMVGGRLKGQRKVASGSDFAGVRPAAPGDPLKQVHWKSSAKGLGLMVKTFEEELSGRVSLITDAGLPRDTAVLDHCLRATASLAYAALDAGHQVEWIDLKSLEPLQIPPFSDGTELLDRLARLVPEPGCLNAETLAAAVTRVSSRSALCFVATEWNAALAETVAALAASRRVVAVYVPEGAAVREAAFLTGRYSAQEIRIA